MNPVDLEKVIALTTPTETRSKVEEIELEALHSLQTSLEEKRPELARLLRPEIEVLSRSGLVSVRNNAQSLLKSLPAAS